MKTLEEKKLLVKMAKMFGQEIDQALVESIEREEKLAAAIFGTPKSESIPILREDVLIEAAPVAAIESLPQQPEKPAETNLQPPEDYKVAQVAAYLNTVKKLPPSKYRDTELEAIRKTVQDLISKVNTLSWGGGGTGIVRLWNADDLDRSTAGNNKVVKYRPDDNGWFYFDTVTGLEDFTYGSFSDTTNQTANTANTPYEVRFNTTDSSKGHYIRNNTEIVANVAGIYNYQFSLQLTSTSSSLDNVYIWIRKNNSDVPNTATIVSLSANKQYAVAAWNFFVGMNAGDHVHLMWATTDTRLSIEAPAATSFCPAVPSVILTVNQINT